MQKFREECRGLLFICKLCSDQSHTAFFLFSCNRLAPALDAKVVLEIEQVVAIPRPGFADPICPQFFWDLWCSVQVLAIEF